MSKQRLSLQLRMGLGPMQTLPRLSKEGQGINEEVLDIVQHEELKPLQQQYASLRPMQTLPSLSIEGQGINEEAFDIVQHEEFKPLQQQYTSLRDLIVVSPTKRGGTLRAQDVEWCDMTELKFKDKLLKLAARAYLQPIVRESTPQTHFLVQCWISFTSRNKSLVFSLIESLQRQAEACIKFFRAQKFNLMQRFKPQRVGVLP